MTTKVLKDIEARIKSSKASAAKEAKIEAEKNVAAQIKNAEEAVTAKAKERIEETIIECTYCNGRHRHSIRLNSHFEFLRLNFTSPAPTCHNRLHLSCTHGDTRQGKPSSCGKEAVGGTDAAVSTVCGRELLRPSIMTWAFYFNIDVPQHQYAFQYRYAFKHHIRSSRDVSRRSVASWSALLMHLAATETTMQLLRLDQHQRS